MTTDLREMDDRWLLGWRGLVVAAAETAGEGIVVQFDDVATLMIGEAASPTVASSLTSQRVPASLSELQELVKLEVLSAVAFKDGTLRLVLGGGKRLDVASSAAGLAWRASSGGSSWTSSSGLLTRTVDA